MTAIHKIFIIHDLVNKLLITKISSAKDFDKFNALVFIKEYADKKIKVRYMCFDYTQIQVYAR